MGIAKTSVIFFHLVILAVSLSDHTVTASGAQMNKISYDHCITMCVEYKYGSRECFVDCTIQGYRMGSCVNQKPQDPIQCCCYN
ncbi:defensin-like protein 49 [Capsella rubella]|uniref:defensin-like protein 49 n=1 Tax=Capsella rubella TaxID=81985 RepID=UPI000CD4A847|nr:defensin-like protein 49 [Capsella rubella]